MRHVKVALACAWTLTLLLAGAPGSAQQTGPTAASDSAAQAMAVLKRTTALLSQAPRFSVTLDIGFDAVQDSDRKSNSAKHARSSCAVRIVSASTPPHATGQKSTLLFDGKNITVVHPQENVYATAARPGSVDEAVAYFVHDLGMRLPLAEMLTSQLAQQLADQVRVADYVEASSIAGVPCDHLAFRGDETDMQVRVAQGQHPLPRRVVITYRHADGRPQFWAQFNDWNLAPEALMPCSLYAARGAAPIAFSPRQQLPGAATTTGGQQR